MEQPRKLNHIIEKTILICPENNSIYLISLKHLHTARVGIRLAIMPTRLTVPLKVMYSAFQNSYLLRYSY